MSSYGWLVLIEAGAKQQFIKRAHDATTVLGASALIRRSGVELILRVISELEATGEFGSWPTDDFAPLDGDCFVVQQSSGKALVMVPRHDDAVRLIWDCTRAALTEMPGLQVTGVAHEVTDLSHDALAETLVQIHRLESRHRTHTPPATARSVAGNPWAEQVLGVSLRTAAARQQQRWRRDYPMIAWFDDLDDLALVHCDGNGIGRRFQLLPVTLRQRLDGADLLLSLGELSKELDACTTRAFDAVVMAAPLGRDGRRPVMPLVLGGDDVTFLVAAEYVTEAVLAFSAAFSTETRRPGTLTQRLWDGLACGIGVAFPRAHPSLGEALLAAELATGHAKGLSVEQGASVALARAPQGAHGSTTPRYVTLEHGAIPSFRWLTSCRKLVVEQQIAFDARFDLLEHMRRLLIADHTDVDLDDLTVPQWRARLVAAGCPDSVAQHFTAELQRCSVSGPAVRAYLLDAVSIAAASATLAGT